jgi:hypothetical protein
MSSTCILVPFLKGTRRGAGANAWFPLIDRNPQRFVPNIFEAGTRISE